MSLTDSDKTNNDRSLPSINAPDGVQNPMAHETVGTTYRTTGVGTNQGVAFQQGAIQSYDQNMLKNMFFGFAPELVATRPVLRIAKTGFDARSTTADNLIFNSEQDVFKIVKKITITNTVTPGGSSAYNQTSQAHGLAYTPSFLPFISFDAGIALGPNPIVNRTSPALIYGTVGATIGIFVLCEVSVDGTNVYFSNQYGTVAGGPYTNTATVYLLQETFS